MSKPHLHQIHPVLPVQNVLAALFFYVNKLGFEIGFADDPKNPTYAGVKRDHIEIHLQLHNAKEWEASFNTSMLRIVTQNVDALFDEYKTKDVFHESTEVKNTTWQTREFAFYDLYKNGLTFYQNI